MEERRVGCLAALLAALLAPGASMRMVWTFVLVKRPPPGRIEVGRPVRTEEDKGVGTENSLLCDSNFLLSEAPAAVLRSFLLFSGLPP